MTDWPAASRRDHERFCAVEGWRRARDAHGRKGTHHVTYEFDLPAGRVLRTRISHPPDRTTYGAALWGHVLRDQLQVCAEGFWACVRDGRRPERGSPTARPDALPMDLVHLLVSRVGLSDTEVAAMSREQAIARLDEYWTTGS